MLSVREIRVLDGVPTVIIEFSQLLRAVRRLWWVAVVGALILGSLGFGVGRLQSPSYTATTQMLVTTQLTGVSVLAENGRPSTFVNLVTSGPVLDRVILELGLDLTREELKDLIVTKQVSGTQIIEISVVSADPQLAADIANSLSRNLMTSAAEVSVGELQRNLDDMRKQASTTRDRIVVVDTRLADIDTEANADDSAIQAEIAQLKREKLQLSQTLADLDGAIRTLNTNLSSSSIPVVITDIAQVPTQSDRSAPMLLGIMGALVGGMAGVAYILYSAFTDRILRDRDQIVSEPVLKRISPAQVQNAQSTTVDVLIGNIAVAGKAAAAERVAIVSPRAQAMSAQLGERMSLQLADDFPTVVFASDVLGNADSVRATTSADILVVLAEVGRTSTEDLEQVAQFASLLGARVLGTVMIK